MSWGCQGAASPSSRKPVPACKRTSRCATGTPHPGRCPRGWPQDSCRSGVSGLENGLDKFRQPLGLEVTAGAVARRYAGLIDVFVSDASDAPLAAMDGVRLLRAPTLMNSVEDRVGLARTVLAAADGR